MKLLSQIALYLTIRLRARVFYEQIVNEVQPSWLSLVENEKFTVVSLHKNKKMSSNAYKRTVLLRYTSSNVTRDVHWRVTVFYQQIENGNIANRIHGFTIDYGKFILMRFRRQS